MSGNAKLAVPIKLADKIVETVNVATIGYPAYDSRIPEPDLMQRIYGKIYNKKRLAPGGVTRVDATHLWHNCTTLGGNSGSAVVDLDSGCALGLHFSGSFLTTNYAVRADVLKQLLANVRSGRPPHRPEKSARSPMALNSDRALGRATTVTVPSGRFETFSIPLTLNITVSLDFQSASRRYPDRGGPVGREAEDFVAETEAVAADYDNRTGYEPNFLGTKIEIPQVTRATADVLDFQVNGETETELRYEHYSVVMSRSRRMCFFSACNIDGNQSKKSGRVAWKWDPRIPKTQQIMKECYGSPPRFSRGHMTRREDPGWGTPIDAKRGNEDSMHVTNATPQMQAFNAPIWLALEDYALQHAREDAMKISVFTGPYFTTRDPTMYGVQIPLAFWKVIAFIHDETGKLCATGYEMNQETSLQPEEEFVFGAFKSPQLGIATQVPIRSIERQSGISFGKLSAVDPLDGVTESVPSEREPARLLALQQIRFLDAQV
jgi:endonuclease G, mitochondrial